MIFGKCYNSKNIVPVWRGSNSPPPEINLLNANGWLYECLFIILAKELELTFPGDQFLKWFMDLKNVLYRKGCWCDFFCRIKCWKVYIIFLKIMLEYHFQHDFFIDDKIYFETILCDKIVYNIFVMLANTWKVFQN